MSKANEELLNEFEGGRSLGELSRKYGIYKRTLQRRLASIHGDRYEELIKRRQIGFGSRTELGDSILETEIRKLLDKNEIGYSFHAKLKLNGHRYIPDFLIGADTIIEVTGMTTRRYWEHTSEKLKRYIENGYRVILVIEHRKLNGLKGYLPEPNEKFVVIEYEKLKTDFTRYAGIVKSN